VGVRAGFERSRGEAGDPGELGRLGGGSTLEDHFGGGHRHGAVAGDEDLGGVVVPEALASDRREVERADGSRLRRPVAVDSAHAAPPRGT
jgi:hypothetical protein